MNRDPILAVTDALTPQQRQRILYRWDLNPRRRGAGVADILETLADYDSDLDVTEPFWEASHEAHPELADHLAASFAVRALIWGRPEDMERREAEALTVDALKELLAKVDAADEEYQAKVDQRAWYREEKGE